MLGELSKWFGSQRAHFQLQRPPLAKATRRFFGSRLHSDRLVPEEWETRPGATGARATAWRSCRTTPRSHRGHRSMWTENRSGWSGRTRSQFRRCRRVRNRCRTRTPRPTLSTSRQRTYGLGWPRRTSEPPPCHHRCSLAPNPCLSSPPRTRVQIRCARPDGWLGAAPSQRGRRAACGVRPGVAQDLAVHVQGWRRLAAGGQGRPALHAVRR